MGRIPATQSRLLTRRETIPVQGMMRSTHIIKPVIFALLGVNAVIYASAGRLSEGLDALGWFALLALFEIETRYPRWTQLPRHAPVLGLLRLIATASIAVAAFAYVREKEWLDATNAWLWISIVAVLELEVRAPAFVANHRPHIMLASVALYCALAVVALAWFVQGEWFDGYDAVLWIAAFALIEMDLLTPQPGDTSRIA